MRRQEFWAAHTTHPITARNKIVAAVCPQLHGLFLAKLALLLALVGGVARPESKLRGDAHLLMVGDPGVGKSQLMKFAARVAGRAVTASGKGSSSAGLTASAVKDDGVWVLEAGALVLADGGVCCIDEFDGIREADRATIHEAMEQQTVHIAKAGMMTKLSTRTTIIAAVNPRPGWRPHQPLTDACTLSGPLLSRFDMVLLLLDKAHPAWDMQVAACVLDNHVQGGQEAQQRSRHLLPDPHPPAGAGWTGQLPGSQAAPQALQGQGAGQGSSSSGGGGWDLDSLRDYLVWVKTTFQPCMSMEAHEVLQAYYVALRGMEERSAARTSLRALESLVRIAQAHARLCARDTVTLQDSVMAVLVVEATAGCLHVVPADHTLFSDFHPEPDTEYVQLEQQ
ncbi:MCM domain-containing protein, partial [Haematococcus lacustris]